MKTILYMLIGILIGFALGMILPEGGLVNSVLITCADNYTGQINGRSFTTHKPIFVTGIADVVRFRSIQEIIQCTNGVTATKPQQVGKSKYEIIPFFVLKNAGNYFW